MDPAEERLTGSGAVLAEQLRHMRLSAGLTQDQLAERLGWGAQAGRPRVSKMENGRVRPSARTLRAWAEVTGNEAMAGELLELLADLKTKHTRWRQGQSDAAVQVERDRRSRAATRIRYAETVLVPGLLQTGEYARAVFTRIGTADVDNAVERRMQRQQVLYDPAKTFEFLVTESVLYLLPCSRPVMLGQLDRLLSLSMGNVTLGILPFGTELPAVLYNSFLLEDDELTVEHLTGKSDEHAGPQAAIYHQVFDALMAVAVTGEDARRLIMSSAEQLRK